MTRSDDHGRTRVIEWSDGSATDLGVLVAALIASAVCAASIVCAVDFHGLAHVVTVVLAALSGLYAAAMIIPMLLIFGGIFAVQGIFV